MSFLSRIVDKIFTYKHVKLLFIQTVCLGLSFYLAVFLSFYWLENYEFMEALLTSNVWFFNYPKLIFSNLSLFSGPGLLKAIICFCPFSIIFFKKFIKKNQMMTYASLGYMFSLLFYFSLYTDLSINYIDSVFKSAEIANNQSSHPYARGFKLQSGFFRALLPGISAGVFYWLITGRRS